MEQELKRTAELFENLRKAFSELSEDWEVNYEGDAFSEEYPFEHSFDEMSLQVSDWVESCVDKISLAKQGLKAYLISSHGDSVEDVKDLKRFYSRHSLAGVYSSEFLNHLDDDHELFKIIAEEGLNTDEGGHIIVREDSSQNIFK